MGLGLPQGGRRRSALREDELGFEFEFELGFEFGFELGLG